MKRYLVFKGDTYYPAGGWEDFFGAFDTLEEAQYALEAKKGSWIDGEWSHIVDTQTMEMLP